MEHLLHILTADFVHRCWLAGVDTIAVGDPTGIRERIDYTDALNQRLHAWPFRKIVSMACRVVWQGCSLTAVPYADHW